MSLWQVTSLGLCKLFTQSRFLLGAFEASHKVCHRFVLSRLVKMAPPKTTSPSGVGCWKSCHDWIEHLGFTREHQHRSFGFPGRFKPEFRGSQALILCHLTGLGPPTRKVGPWPLAS